MNITKPINRKGKTALTLGAGLVLSCSAIYAANKEVKGKNIITTQDSILELRDDDGITYINENDNFYIEKDGQRREMTDAERAAFERKHEKTMAELEVTEEEVILMEKEIEESLKELEIQAAERESATAREIEIATIEMEKAHEELSKAQEEIELEFESGNLSEQEMQRVKESLKRAQKEMMRERENIDIDMARVKRDLQQAKANIRTKVKVAPGSKTDAMVIADEIIIDVDKSDHVVKWASDDGKVYVKENGEYRIKEGDKMRAMTEEEKARFEEKVKLIPKPAIPPQPSVPSKPPKPTKPDNVSALTPVQQIQAHYPVEAEEQGIEGVVNLSFDVDQSGKPTNIAVVSSSSDGIFNKEAIAAVKQWTFADKDFGKRDQMYQVKFALN